MFSCSSLVAFNAHTLWLFQSPSVNPLSAIILCVCVAHFVRSTPSSFFCLVVTISKIFWSSHTRHSLYMPIPLSVRFSNPGYRRLDVHSYPYYFGCQFIFPCNLQNFVLFHLYFLWFQLKATFHHLQGYTFHTILENILSLVSCLNFLFQIIPCEALVADFTSIFIFHYSFAFRYYYF